MATCPCFKDNQCSIYEIRPKCCRSFPNRTKGMYCVKSICGGRCDICTDKCCTHLDIKEPMTLYDTLNISCDECQEMYCKNTQPHIL